jgi:hypothetical protein
MANGENAALAGGIFGGISAITGIISAIDGAGRANEANRRAKQNAEIQRAQQEGAAQITNAYNKLVHAADQINYQRQREYEYETAIRNWNYQTEIQDFQYLQAAKHSAILRASLMSSGAQSERNIRDISMSRYADDIKARNAMMIEPERLPDIPKPTMAPERIFVEPMAAMPGYVPGPATQSAAAPIFQGLSSAAATVGGMAMQASYYGRNSGGTTTTKVTPQTFDYKPSSPKILTDYNSRA